MTISPVSVFSFTQNQQKISSKNSNFYFRTQPLIQDTISFQSCKKTEDYDKKLFKEIGQYYQDDEVKFNEKLKSLDDEQFISGLRALSDNGHILTLLKMDEENIDRLYDLSQNEFKYNAFTEDEFGNTVFHFADAEKLGQIFKYLNQEDISNGVLRTNILGANAFHMSTYNPQKLTLICDSLDKKAIIIGTLSEDGWRSSPFYSYETPQFKILLEKLEPEDVDTIVCNENKNGKDVFWVFPSDKLDVVCSKMTTGTIKELIKEQDEWGRTSFHKLDNDSIGVLCKYLSQEDIDEF